MTSKNFDISKLIIHILDTNANSPILSDDIMEISNELYEYFSKHLEKILNNDDLKDCTFNQSSDFLQTLKSNRNDFVNLSKLLSTNLFSIIKSNLDITGADIVFIYYTYKKNKYLAILKLNYNTSFVHCVESNKKITVNKIITHNTILPNINQKIDESIIINLTDYNLRLIEKKVMFKNKKDYYLSKYFLDCKQSLSNKTKFDMLTKIVSNINSKYYEDNISNTIHYKKTLKNELESQGTVNINNLPEIIFPNNEIIKKELVETINDNNLTGNIKPLRSVRQAKKINRQLIKTNTGIELNIPIEDEILKNSIEFINNKNGTISILVKNIEKIYSK